jgi:lipopolysaccharide export LptBFGC system permease protein LptF
MSGMTVYEFAQDGSRLQSVYRSERAEWRAGDIRLTGNVEHSVLGDGNVIIDRPSEIIIRGAADPLGRTRSKPSQLTAAETREMRDGRESDIEKRSLSVALEKKYATLVLPFVIALFTAPFSLSLSRKGKVVTVGYAVGLWLVFTAVMSTFEQLGSGGYISPASAVWSPIILFSMLGIFLLSRVRT